MNEFKKIILNIILPAIAVIAMNVLVFSLGWDSEQNNQSSWLNPPGALIGTVWIGLFILMGIARYLVQKANIETSKKYARWIIYYMLFCLSYPLYTLGLQNEIMSFIGNAATFLLASYLIAKIYPVSAKAAWCLLPVLPWIIYATATML